jgi:hypothetical protein
MTTDSTSNKEPNPPAEDVTTRSSSPSPTPSPTSSPTKASGDAPARSGIHLLYTLRPLLWIQSGVLVILGVYNTRFTIGFDWMKAQMLYGSLIYFLFTCSIVLENNYFRLTSFGPSPAHSQQKSLYLGLSLTTYVGSLGLGLYHTLKYSLGIRILVPLILLSVGFGLTYFLRHEVHNHIIFRHVVYSLTFGFAVVFGGILNRGWPPLYLVSFGVGIFGIQFAKYLLASFQKGIFGGDSPLRILRMPLTTKNFAHLLVGILGGTLLAFILPNLVNIFNPTLYFFAFLVILILVTVAGLLTWNLKYTDHIRKTAHGAQICVNIGIGVMYLALLLAGF